MGHSVTVPFGGVRMQASRAAAAIGGRLHGPDVEFDGASFDTRSLQPGQLFVPIVAERDGHDFIGAAYWPNNLKCLKTAGRLVLVGLMGGAKVEADLGLIMRKRLQVIGSVMRSQPLENKIAITERFRSRWLPELESGRLQPLIDTSFPLAEAAAAHQYMEDNRNVGKIMLVME